MFVYPSSLLLYIKKKLKLSFYITFLTNDHLQNTPKECICLYISLSFFTTIRYFNLYLKIKDKLDNRHHPTNHDFQSVSLPRISFLKVKRQTTHG